jgi:hypothetical protein
MLRLGGQALERILDMDRKQLELEQKRHLLNARSLSCDPKLKHQKDRSRDSPSSPSLAKTFGQRLTTTWSGFVADKVIS